MRMLDVEAVSGQQANRQPARKAGPEESAGFHVSWYPLALSSEVESGAIIAKNVLGSRVIIYRDAAGRPIVQSSYCPHLGTDLSVGQVVDGQIRCAFHHWTFDRHGTCVNIAIGDKIPPGAKIFTYPSAEAWGLIWAFNGPTPLFDMPTVPDVDESDIVYETILRDVLPIEPWMIRANTLDFQHFRALHGFPATEPERVDFERYRVEFHLKLDKVGFEQHARITGTNTFSQRFHYGPHSKFFDFGKTFGGDDVFFLYTGTPVEDGKCTFFAMIGVRKPAATTPDSQEATQRKLKRLREFSDFLYEEDRRIFMTIRFHQGVLTAADRHLARFFKYANEYPRVQPIDATISSRT
jgi:phenylpropionate dioxygenase-like ring-hydroxylating dioxygenase large terminal subunit